MALLTAGGPKGFGKLRAEGCPHQTSPQTAHLSGAVWDFEDTRDERHRSGLYGHCPLPQGAPGCLNPRDLQTSSVASPLAWLGGSCSGARGRARPQQVEARVRSWYSAKPLSTLLPTALVLPRKQMGNQDFLCSGKRVFGLVTSQQQTHSVKAPVGVSRAGWRRSWCFGRKLSTCEEARRFKHAVPILLLPGHSCTKGPVPARSLTGLRLLKKEAELFW